jgi:hypothetical protein
MLPQQMRISLAYSWLNSPEDRELLSDVLRRAPNLFFSRLLDIGLQCFA